MAEVGTVEVGIAEVGIAEVGNSEVGTGEVGIAEDGVYGRVVLSPCVPLFNTVSETCNVFLICHNVSCLSFRCALIIDGSRLKRKLRVKQCRK